jgi:hypothetical protein
MRKRHAHVVANEVATSIQNEQLTSFRTENAVIPEQMQKTL